MPATLHEPVVLPIHACQPVDWNPNIEDVATFNELVSAIEADGFTDPIIVVEYEGTYSIVAGEHRWKAAKLAGLEEITAVVMPWDLDEQKIKSIRHNVIRGKFDPDKFAALWTDLQQRIDRKTLVRATGMSARERELERLLGRVKKSLPKQMRDELEKREDKIRNVEDLASVVQSLYAQHGNTLDSSYMFLTFGGRVHLMIKMNDQTSKQLATALALMRSDGHDANELIVQALDQLTR